MNLGTARKPRVVLDSNIIISAVVYRGKPRIILDLAFEQRIETITSPALLVEVIEVLAKKFQLSKEELDLINEEIKNDFAIIHPRRTLHIVRDEDDNRVLEAALEGKCDFIVTGDRDLLNLGQFKNIKIITPDEFLREIE